jgi:recombination protein RecT
MTGQQLTTGGAGDLVATYRNDFAMVLPSHIKAETWVRLAQGVFRRDKNLAAAAQRNPGSVMVALLECARLGHEPGTDAFYLVPMGGEVEGWEGYKGLVQRMYRAGKVTSVKAEVVREHDVFTFHPGMDFPDHQPSWFSDRGEVIGAYAYARLVDGSFSRVVVLNKAELDKVKKESRGSGSPSSPWVKWYDAMVLKTVVKRLEPWVTTSTEWITDQLRAAHEAAKPAGPTVEAHAPEPVNVTAATEIVYDDEGDSTFPADGAS